MAQEIKTDNRLDLFAATPPTEAKKMLISMAVTSGIGCTGNDRGAGMCIHFIDISQAFLHADAKRKAYIKLPDEDYEKGMRGLLKRSLYGTRGVAQNWGGSYMELMDTQGFIKGKASPCSFEPKRNLRCVVHGDDFVVL